MFFATLSIKGDVEKERSSSVVAGVRVYRPTELHANISANVPFYRNKETPHVCLPVLMNRISPFGCIILFIVSSLCLLICEYNFMLQTDLRHYLSVILRFGLERISGIQPRCSVRSRDFSCF